MAPLTTKSRNALPTSSFAGPDRSYPINDPSHARNALSRAAQFASPSEQASIRAKVKKKFPSIGMKKAADEGRVSRKSMEKRGYSMGDDNEQ